MELITDVGAMPVAPLVADTVVRVAPGASVADVARALTEADVGLLIVGDGTEVTGVISERDVMHLIAGGGDPATTRAVDIAHTSLVWCDTAATIGEVAEEMMERYVRHVLVED